MRTPPNVQLVRPGGYSAVSLICAARFRLSLALLAAASGVLLVAGCGGSGASSNGSNGSGGTQASIAPVLNAAYATSLAPGYKFDMTISVSVGEHDVTIKGSGSLDERAARGSMSMNVAGKTISEVISNPYIYIEVPGKTGAHSWARMNISVFTEALGAGGSPFGGGSQSPAQMLKFLKAVGTVTDLGAQKIQGTTTEHYHATIDFNRYAAQAAPSKRASAARYAAVLKRVAGTTSLPMDVWVDARKHVRRIAMNMRLCTQEGPLTESIAMDLFDYARQPAVAPPPAGQFTDITDKLKSTVTKGLEQLHCQ